MCTVQTAHGATRPLDRLTTEYLTCTTISGPLHQVSYSCHDPRRCMNAAPATYTPRDKQTRFSKRNKGKRETKQTYLGFKFKHRQVNDSSQSNQKPDHLNSQLQTIMLKQSIRFLST
jgi:hypothetical protein